MKAIQFSAISFDKGYLLCWEDLETGQYNVKPDLLPDWQTCEEEIESILKDIDQAV
jgi:hypothetical protein